MDSKFSIRGFIETSFLDWDGKITSVIFLPNCNLNCSYCSNSVLVNYPETLREIDFEHIKSFIVERKDFIDGIVITGGEPTIQPWLIDLIKEIKALGFLIKLDTNGINPKVLSQLLSPACRQAGPNSELPTPNSRLVDYIAMDVKAPLNEKYKEVCGTDVDLNAIRESIKLLINSGIEHEFRTTVVAGSLDNEDIKEIAKSIVGAKKFALQQFVPRIAGDEKLRETIPHSKEKLQEMAKIAKEYIPNTIVRGI
ncbi:MAG: radical SAM protein [Candidatus Margulisiibacteriota bacterium]